MNRVADKNGLIARRATQVATATRYWQSQQLREQPPAASPAPAASRTVSWQQSFYDAKERNTASARF
jgi:hypothetical protein